MPEDHLLRGQVVDQLRGGDQQREVSDGKQRLLGQHGGGFVIQKKSFKIFIVVSQKIFVLHLVNMAMWTKTRSCDLKKSLRKNHTIVL